MPLFRKKPTFLQKRKAVGAERIDEYANEFNIGSIIHKKLNNPKAQELKEKYHLRIHTINEKIIFLKKQKSKSVT